MSLWKNNRTLDRGERCPARPCPAVAGRAALVCATACAIILQPVIVMLCCCGVVVWSLSKTNGLAPADMRSKNMASNSTKYDTAWRLLTMINSTYCDHFKLISYSFRRTRVLTLLPKPARAAKLDKLDFA